MHTHDVDSDPVGSLHLSVSREADQADPTMVQAAVEGRTDAINPSAVMHLQRLAGNSSVGSLLTEGEPSPVHEVVGSGGGAPLDSKTLSVMEERLGQDFSDVRVHTGAKANESAGSVNAHAYTVGNDVVFNSGQYAPETSAGMHTLAHELTHVIQQRSGPVDGTEAGGGIKVSDPGDSFERAAERSADHVMAQPAAPASLGSPAAASPSVQRETKPGDEEDEVQTLAMQRAADTEDDLAEEEKKAG